MLARLTLNAMMMYDNSLFDELSLPEGVDKDAVVNAVMDKGSTFGLIYTDFDFLKKYIGVWGLRHYRMFQRWTLAREIEYDPIDDRHINRVREGSKGIEENESKEGGDSRSKNVSKSGTDNRSNENSVTGSESVSKSSETNETSDSSSSATTSNRSEHQISAYDSNSYSPESVTIDSGSNSSNTDNTKDVTESGSESRNSSESEEGSESGSYSESAEEGSEGSYNESRNVDRGEEERIEESETGRTGRRTVQEMLQAEYDIARFEVEEKIADMLVMDICIMVY